MTAQRIAVVGGGISGIAAAHQLQHDHAVTLFEAAPRLGGHTDTHQIWRNGRTYAVDSGFIVFNERNYPQFSAWLDALGVTSQPSDMSFGVCNRRSGVEYGSGGLQALYCQKRNLVSPAFASMLRDIARFYKQAPAVLAQSTHETLGAYLVRNRYGRFFIDNHLVPMCAALWSQPMAAIFDAPVRHVVAFMQNHLMLQLKGRPQWHTITGGSSTYVKAFQAQFRGRVQLSCPVTGIVRTADGVHLSTRHGTTPFDAVVLACHSDDALMLLRDASMAERTVLSAMRYQSNTAVVHSDARLMPRNRQAWSSWNAQICDRSHLQCTVSYWMNRLQSLTGSQDFFVTLNPTRPIASSLIWAERRYRHPVFDVAATRAQARLEEIQGHQRTYFCGAYWGWGFHEDGFASATRAVAALRETQERRHAA